MRPADCHPDQKHHAHGLCRRCYNRGYMREAIRRSPAKYLERSRRDRAEHQVEYHARDRKYKLLRYYGLTIVQYESLNREQEGRCAICGRSPQGNLDVDHNSVTGKIRGLLCNPCNRGLGYFGDSSEGLQQALDYLEIRGAR